MFEMREKAATGPAFVVGSYAAASVFWFAPPPLVLEGATVPSLHSVTFNWSHYLLGTLAYQPSKPDSELFQDCDLLNDSCFVHPMV
ncbi:hypothetical protein PIB30_039131, partial [Stylosanthes scabra]|nr:hypothetical protein [Stylosanthes scabra]